MNEFGEVEGERGEVGGVERTAIERAAVLHPCRRRPGESHDLHPGIDGDGLAQGGKDVGLVVVNREVLHGGIGVVVGEVVVGIAAEREVSGAHGLT